MAILKTNMLSLHRKRPLPLAKALSSNSDVSSSNLAKSSSSTSMSEQSSPKKRVQFSTVKVCFHSLIVGDNPAVSKGVPLTLSWAHNSCETFSLDQHDTSGKVARKLSPYVREQIAQSAGASKQVLVQTREEVREIQRSRELAMEVGFWERIRHPHMVHKRF